MDSLQLINDKYLLFMAETDKMRNNFTFFVSSKEVYRPIVSAHLRIKGCDEQICPI